MMKKILITIFMVFAIQNLFAQIQYPETPKIAVKDTLHGIVITDNYRWLEDGENPDVINWEEK